MHEILKRDDKQQNVLSITLCPARDYNIIRVVIIRYLY